MNNRLKSKIIELYNICDMLDKTPYGMKQIDAFRTTRDVLSTDMTIFLMYLSTSDGTVTLEETSFIKEYMEWEFSPEELQQNIDLALTCITDFETKVPRSIQLFIDADNAMYDPEDDYPFLSETLYYIFAALGLEFLECDINTPNTKMQFLKHYLNIQYKYIQQKVNYIHKFEPVNISIENNDARLKTTDGTEREDQKNLTELLQQLDSLIGLENVKNDVRSLINLLQIRKLKEQKGMKQMPMSLHLVFSGNPGTGKTTVARLLAKIYYKLGILRTDHLIEVDRSSLVGGYVGQTAIKVQEVIQKSLGGILFIDEAYSLTAGKEKHDYGAEAVATLLKAMEDHRDDLIVIVAGYPDLMHEFLDSNPGLRSRFNKFIHFPDYKPEELVKIFENMCKNSSCTATNDCIGYVKKHFEEQYTTRESNFANARYVRNFFEIAMVNQANRLSMDLNLTDEELTELTLEDVETISI